MRVGEQLRFDVQAKLSVSAPRPSSAPFGGTFPEGKARGHLRSASACKYHSCPPAGGQVVRPCRDGLHWCIQICNVVPYYSLYPLPKENAPRCGCSAGRFVLALPIFPVSHPTSIFGGNELNFCVRYGNRWTLIPISTNYSVQGCALKTGHHGNGISERHIRACILL